MFASVLPSHACLSVHPGPSHPTFLRLLEILCTLVVYPFREKHPMDPSLTLPSAIHRAAISAHQGTRQNIEFPVPTHTHWIWILPRVLGESPAHERTAGLEEWLLWTHWLNREKRGECHRDQGAGNLVILRKGQGYLGFLFWHREQLACDILLIYFTKGCQNKVWWTLSCNSKGQN